MTLSWPQLLAYLELNEILDRRERANDLWVAATAQGDGKTINNILKDLGAAW
jgi:hypothetical protein